MKKHAFDSRLGEQLYQLLPEVYRTRDKTAGQGSVTAGDESLARYLDAHGHMLDLIHSTLKQQLDDALPESCQDWLLPYFAQLLAANIVSPDSEGKHAEIKHAVSWRQRKGTLKCAEEIAEAVGQMEVEIQEGWKRVAMTPRVGMPIIPAKALDSTLNNIDMSVPSEAVRHPSLPVAMVDLRQPSRSVEAQPSNPAARVSSFGGVKQTWRQVNAHGVPCFPGSFDDISRRTVDMRTPDTANGHYHHKRLLAYVPPPTGLFPYDPLIRTWDEALQKKLIEVKLESDVLVYSNSTKRILLIHKTSAGDLKDKVELEAGKNYRIDNIHFSGKLLLKDGQLELSRVEVKKVQVNTFSTDKPVLTADNCLFNELSVGKGIAELDSCTVRDMAYLKDVDVIDSILMKISDPEIFGTIQYSRIPESLNNNSDKRTVEDCTSDDPVFFKKQIELAARSVLSPNTPQSIYAGASDGGEMGFFHHGRKGRPVRIIKDFTGTSALNLPTIGGYPLNDVVFEGKLAVASGTLELVRSAVKSLIVDTALSNDTNVAIPVLDAKNCLFNNLTVSLGLARLEYCTVMDKADCKLLQASDCIFAGSITSVTKPNTGMQSPSFLNCVRYSKIPDDLDPGIAKVLRVMNESNKITPGSNTMETPVFNQFDYCKNGEYEEWTAVFGEPGYGVLNPSAPDAIRFGAEDGGEMGVYHHKYYNLKAEAVLDKMREFLPVGIEPVLIQDTRLLHIPPEKINSEEPIDNGEG